MHAFGLYHYWVFSILLMVGLYGVITKLNLIKKIISLSLFQTAVFLFYITMGKVQGGTAPIVLEQIADWRLSNPLPQVFILTAIVVSISTVALGLGIIVRIKEEYGTLEEHEIQEIDSH